MEDKIYLKTTHDGLWEKNATKGAAVYMIVGTIIFFASISLLASIEVFFKYKLGFDGPFCSALFDLISYVWDFAGILGIAMICILANQSHNISKSTAFIVRQGQMYVVQLFYTNRK